MPHRPPDALRARVLATAREAASRSQAGLLAQLFHDRLLRLCAAALLALCGLNAIVVDRTATRNAASRVADVGDGIRVPADDGLTAAEQVAALAKES